MAMNDRRSNRNEEVRVVVTGMGNPLGQNIYKALKLSALPLCIYVMDAQAFSAGLLWEHRAVVCPMALSANFVDEFIGFIRREQIDIVFFGTEAEPSALLPHLARIREATSTCFILNEPSVLEIADDKFKTAQALAA